MTNNKYNKNILVTLCVIFSTYWFLFFLYNTQEYTISSTLEAIFTLMALAGVGLYILIKDLNNILPNRLITFYAGILVCIGIIDALMDMSFIGNSNFNVEILLCSIVCEVFYIVVGGILYWGEKE